RREPGKIARYGASAGAGNGRGEGGIAGRCAGFSVALARGHCAGIDGCFGKNGVSKAWLSREVRRAGVIIVIAALLQSVSGSLSIVSLSSNGAGAVARSPRHNGSLLLRNATEGVLYSATKAS